MVGERRRAPSTPKKKRGRPRKVAVIQATMRSPNTDRLCTRAHELAAKHVPGTDLCPSSRSLLIQLRTAIKAKKPCEFTEVGQLESLFKIRRGYISELATKQSRTGMITTLPRSGRPAEHWEDGDWFNRAHHPGRYQGRSAQGLECNARVCDFELISSPEHRP